MPQWRWPRRRSWCSSGHHSEQINVNDTNERPEPLRAWYKRRTRTAIRALIFASLITIVAAVLLWVLAELPFLARMQTFNGAIIIPAFGGIWIASFMFIWLIPMRELSFRGQESLDRTEDRMKEAVETFAPVAKVWERIGKRVEEEILPKIEKTLDDAHTAIAEARARVGPAAESIRRVENNLEGKIGLLATEVEGATRSIKKFFGPQGEPPDIAAAASYVANPPNGRPHEQGARR